MAFFMRNDFRRCLRVFSLEKEISGNKAFGKVSVEGELDRFRAEMELTFRQRETVKRQCCLARESPGPVLEKPGWAAPWLPLRR